MATAWLGLTVSGSLGIPISCRLEHLGPSHTYKSRAALAKLKYATKHPLPLVAGDILLCKAGHQRIT